MKCSLKISSLSATHFIYNNFDTLTLTDQLERPGGGGLWKLRGEVCCHQWQQIELECLAVTLLANLQGTSDPI